MEGRSWLFGFPLVLLVIVVSPALADDAEVLPKGVRQTRVEYIHYLPITERFNPDGNKEDVAVNFNANLNGDVFPDLALLEAFFGLPAGSATLGRSVVDFEYELEKLNFSFNYGVTDRLSVGFYIPYWWVKNNVSARLDSATATIGKNPAVPGGLAPLGVPGTVPLTTDDVQSILGGGLDVNGDGTVDVPGFGFKRVETWSNDGVGDIEANFRYQYFRSDRWKLAFTGGIRFPTGEKDDPDNLVDYPLGEGVYQLLFRLNNDFKLLENLTLNGTIRYDLALPDHETLRVPPDPNQPITTNKENVDRDIGDLTELEFSARYKLTKTFSLSAYYRYTTKQKDRIKGSRGFSYEALEEETDTTDHLYSVALAYSTIDLYREKKFSIPLIVSIRYRDRFAGTNNVFDSEYVSLAFQVFF